MTSIENLAFGFLEYEKIISDVQKSLVKREIDEKDARHYAPVLVNVLEDMRYDEFMQSRYMVPAACDSADSGLIQKLHSQDVFITPELFDEIKHDYDNRIITKYLGQAPH